MQTESMLPLVNNVSHFAEIYTKIIPSYSRSLLLLIFYQFFHKAYNPSSLYVTDSLYSTSCLAQSYLIPI